MLGGPEILVLHLEREDLRKAGEELGSCILQPPCLKV